MSAVEAFEKSGILRWANRYGFEAIFRNKVAIVIATRGIGQGIAVGLAEAGGIVEYNRKYGYN